MQQRAASSPSRTRRVARFGISFATTALLLGALIAVAVPAAGRLSGRWQVVPILSGSMAPQMPVGSLVLATRAPLASVRKGDVIVFHIPIGDHHTTAHRIVKVIEGGAHPVVRTKGDANAQPDPWNARLDESTVWKVRATLPVIGYAAVLMREAWIAVLMSGLAVIGLLTLALRRVWRHEQHGAHRHVAARH